MLKFYRNTSITLFALMLITSGIVYVGTKKSELSASLFPGRDTGFLWTMSAEPTSPVGKTAITMKNDVGVVEYDFYLDLNQPFPYSHYSMYFIEPNQGYRMVDLSRYNDISFKVICDPKNVLLLVLFSFDDKVTDLRNIPSRRFSRTAFSCNNHWNTIRINFDELDTPHWWLSEYGFDLSDKGYQLNKTMGFAWANSSQSPLNTLSHVRITDVKLSGKDYRYIYAAVTISLLIWGIALFILFRQYINTLAKQLQKKLKQDQHIIAYKKLSIEPQKDKVKSSLLSYIATEYAHPELSLETTAATLGINRSKINDILKEELGLTFTAYLNKLRLTEAARLLSEIEDANVSEIAYSVGYNNISYFNKLFKNEYHCTPKTFKSFYQNKNPDSD